MKKIATLLICILFVFSFVSMSFAASIGTADIVGHTAKTVTVQTGQGMKAVITLGNGFVTQDMSFNDHINAAKVLSGGMIPELSVNGTYFNSYYNINQTLSFPDNCASIQQTTMYDGKVINGGGSEKWPTLGFTEDGKALIDMASLAPYIKAGSLSIDLWGVNKYYNDPAATMLFTEELGYPVTISNGGNVYTIENGVVKSITSNGTYTPEKGQMIFVAPSTYWGIKSLKVGTKFELNTRITCTNDNQKDWDNVITAIAGNPPIVMNCQDATNSYNVTEAKVNRDAVLQRTYAAVYNDGRLEFGTVQASPAQLATALIAKGASAALCLDGGSSSALASSGTTLTNPGRKLASVLHIYNGNIPKPKTSFTDVPVGAYYEDAVAWALEKNITNGTSATTFGSNDTCTRGQVVTFLWRANGQPSPAASTNPFNDISENDYCYQAILWAVEKGITNGTSDVTFSPDAKCENQQILTFIYRAISGQAGAVGYAESLEWAKANNLLTGTYVDVFNSAAACTRANTVEYLYRYMTKVQ